MTGVIYHKNNLPRLLKRVKKDLKAVFCKCAELRSNPTRKNKKSGEAAKNARAFLKRNEGFCTQKTKRRFFISLEFGKLRVKQK